MTSRLQTIQDNFFRLFTLLLFCVTIVAVPITPEAAETVGEVAKKRMDVYGTPPDGDRERKYLRSDVMFGELIETSGGGAILIQMLDDTELYLGEYASLVIDDFVYEPGNALGKAVYHFTKGTLRLISGKMNSDGVTILTPNASVGIRGSEAIIFVTPAGKTIVNVTKGTFSVRSREAQDLPAVTVQAGQNVSLTGVRGFSSVEQGVSVPQSSKTPGAKEADYKSDLSDLRDGSGLDKERGGGGGGDGGGGGH